MRRIEGIEYRILSPICGVNDTLEWELNLFSFLKEMHAEKPCQNYNVRVIIVKKSQGKECVFVERSKEAQEAALHPAVPRRWLLVAAETVIRSRCTVIYNAGL